jgi:hypothetical protein
MKAQPVGDCWEWQGSRLPSGYGKFGVHGVIVTAHRVALTLALGHPPRHQAIHSCDNPSCVNPAHLRDGTQVDNMTDCAERGRKVDPPRGVGVKNGSAILDDFAVRAIRTRVAGGERQADVARAYGVTRKAVNEIIRGRTWKHVPVTS